MSYINTGLGYLMKWCYQFTLLIGFESYALALLLFALIMQVVLFPFGIKQQKNSCKQAAMKPKEMAIRNKYKGRNDKPTQQKMQQEISQMYQEERFNPLSGCLPMLIQLPVLFALYEVVRNPLTYICQLTTQQITAMRNFFGFASDLEITLVGNITKNLDAVTNYFSNTGKEILIPKFSFFGSFLDLSGTPSTVIKDNWSQWTLLLIPIITFAAAYFGQKLTRKYSYTPDTVESGSTMKTMNILMPLMSLYFAFIWPAAMGLYWIYRSLLSFGQQYVLSRMYPLPKFTEQELKAAEKLYQAKEKQNEPRSSYAKIDTKRSLVYDDDDDIPSQAGGSDLPAAQKPAEKSKYIEQAPLKDDDK